MAGLGINAVRVPVGYWVLATSQVSDFLDRLSLPSSPFSHVRPAVTHCIF